MMNLIPTIPGLVIAGCLLVAMIFFGVRAGRESVAIDSDLRMSPNPGHEIEQLEHDLGIKGHEKDCPLCAQPKPLTTLTGYAVLHDSKQREASDRVPVTCEVRPPRQTSPGNVTLDIRIKESPITLIPTRFDGPVWAVVVFDQDADASMSLGRSGQMIRRGDVFTITS